MDLRLEGNSYVPNCTKVLSKSDISKAKRLFYELGYYASSELTNWRPTGVFKEIHNIDNFVSTDKRLDNPDFINHHNFYLWQE